MSKVKVQTLKVVKWFCNGAIFALISFTLWAQSSADSPSSQQPSQPPASPQSELSQPKATPTPDANDTAEPETIVSSKEAKELFRSVDEILQFASQDTALPIEHKVKRRLTKRDEVQSYIEKSMKDDKDAKRLERSAEVLKKFGLLPKNFDLPSFLVAMLREQVAGYYDVKTKTVNLLNWVDVEAQKPVLAHELTHALQDQSFGLEQWMKGSRPDSDKKKNDPTPDDIKTDEESSARQAVVEGQAMVVLLDYSLASQGKSVLDAPEIVDTLEQGMLQGTSDSPKFREAPIFIKEELTFPYRYGLEFTRALLKSGGKELAYAGAFKDPPKTTREIMEPQTYIAHEKLEPLRMVDLQKDFAGYEPYDIGAMGEFDVDLLIQQYAGRKAANAMYPEWRGGYYYAGKPRSDKLKSDKTKADKTKSDKTKSDASAPIGVIYLSRWSSPAKAAEFAAIYAKSLTLRYENSQPLSDDGKLATDAPPANSWRTLRGRHSWLTEEGMVVIEVRGDEILISESLDDATTKKVEADFWPIANAAPANP